MAEQLTETERQALLQKGLQLQQRVRQQQLPLTNRNINDTLWKGQQKAATLGLPFSPPLNYPELDGKKIDFPEGVDQLNALHDTFYAQKGLDTPLFAPDEQDQNEWVDEYLFQQDQDPVFSPFHIKATQLEKTALGAIGKIQYAAAKLPPSEREKQAVFKDLLKTYFNSNITSWPEGKQIRGPINVPPDFPYDRLYEIYSLWKQKVGSTTFLGTTLWDYRKFMDYVKLPSEDVQLLNDLEPVFPTETTRWDRMWGQEPIPNGLDIFPIIDKHFEWGLSRLRQERLSGHPILRDKTFNIPRLVKYPGMGAAEATIAAIKPPEEVQANYLPTDPKFHWSLYAHLSPTLTNLYTQVEKERQAQSEGLPDTSSSATLGDLTAKGIMHLLTGIGKGLEILSGGHLEPLINHFDTTLLPRLTQGAFTLAASSMHNSGVIDVQDLKNWSSPHSYEAYVKPLVQRPFNAAMSIFNIDATDPLYNHAQYIAETYEGDPAYTTAQYYKRLSSAKFADLALQRMTEISPYSPFKVLVGDSPQLRQTVSGIVGGLVEDAPSFALLALGSTLPLKLLGRTGKLPHLLTDFQRSMAKYGYTTDDWVRLTKIEEEILKAGGDTTAVAGAIRAPLVQLVEDGIKALPDKSSAWKFLDNVHEELVKGGPLDGELTAGIYDSLVQARNVLYNTQGVKLTPAAQRALINMAEPVADLGLADALLVVKGGIPSAGPNTSAHLAKLLHDFWDEWQHHPNLDIPRAVQAHLGKDGLKKVERFRTALDELDLYNKKIQRGTQFSDDLIPKKTLQLQLETDQLARLQQLRADSIAQYNKSIFDAFERWRKLEYYGGEIPVANAALKTDVYKYLFEARQGVHTLDNLLDNKAAWKALTGDEGAALATALKNTSRETTVERLTARQRVADLLEDYLDLNSRPDFKAIPAATAPKDVFLRSMQSKFAESHKAWNDKLVPLTASEAEELYKFSRVPHKTSLPLPATQIIQVFDKELKSSAARIKQTESHLKTLDEFKQFLSQLDPVKPRTFKMHPSLVKEFETMFSEPGWTLKNKKYVSLHDSMRDLDGISAWRELTGTLSKDYEQLRLGLKRYGDLDFAFMETFYPDRIAYALREHLRIAQDMEDAYRWLSEKYIERRGRHLSPEDWQDFHVANYEGKVFKKDPELQQMFHQDIVRALNYDAYRTGRISKDTFQKMVDNKNYYRGIYERADLLELPRVPFKKPSKYGELRQMPSEYEFKIPHTGWYVTAMKGKKRLHKNPTTQEPWTFKTKAEAEAFLEKPNNGIPKGAKVSVQPGWSFQAREASGMIVDAPSAHLDLVERMSLNNANAMIADSIAQSRTFARRSPPPGLAKDVSGFVDDSGFRWYRIDDARVPQLQGQYVHEFAVDWLNSVRAKYGWYKELSKSMTGGDPSFWGSKRSLLKNPLIPADTKLAELVFGRPAPSPGMWAKAVTTMGNMLGLSKVALAPQTYVKQWTSNLLYNLPAAGFDVVTPRGFMRFSHYVSQGAQTAAEPWKDPIWNLLARNGFVEASSLEFDQLRKALLRQNWSSLKGLQAREARLSTALRELPSDPTYGLGGGFFPNKAAEYFKIFNKRNEIRNEIALLTQKQFGTWTQRQFSSFKDLLKSLGKGFVETITGEGRLSHKLYSAVAAPDTLSKYALASYLKYNVGLRDSQIVLRVDQFMQNLHRVPDAVKLLNQRIGGSKFTTYPFNQMKVFANVIKHQPQFLAKYWALQSAWNYSMMYMTGHDPNEILEKHGLQNWGKRSVISDISYMLGRHYLPNGMQISADPVWGWALPKSMLFRNFDNKIKESDAPHLIKAGSHVALGVTSKFLWGSPVINFLGQLYAQKDYRNNPINTPGRIFDTFFGTITPDWMPGIGRDYKEFRDFLTTPYKDPRTRQTRSIIEYGLRRLDVLPSTLYDDSYRTAAIVLNEINTADKDAPELVATIPFDENLEARLMNAGLYDDRGVIPDEKKDRAIEIIQQYSAEHPEVIFGASRAKTQKDFERIYNHKKWPNIYENFRNIPLDMKILAYAKTSALNKTSNAPQVLQNFFTILDRQIDTYTYDWDPKNPDTFTTQNIFKEFERWTSDPSVPSPTRSQLLTWEDKVRRLSQVQHVERKVTLPSTILRKRREESQHPPIELK